ncbi:MAG: oxidoreductase [Aureispira sp.]
MAKTKWDANNIPNQEGKIIVITGASSGLGKEAARVLAGKKAKVIMAVRNIEKTAKVAQAIKQEFPDAQLDIRKLDLSSLASVKNFADGILADYTRLDVLINNAGVMLTPDNKTVDGFELQMGVNHFGHFALTGHLLPLLQQTKDARIIATSSVAHRYGDINFEDINWEKRSHNSAKAYSDSKLANLYFAYELVHRLQNTPNAPLVVAAHPGYTNTDLQQNSLFWRALNPIVAQSVAMGTLPTLRAAIDPNAKAGEFYAPTGFLEIKGYPVVVKSNNRSYNKTHAKQLWELSETLTGVQYSF